ncbi:MAG: hypothetical protein HS126_02610 [Anaerolineales bacterium]|nr:hypothetical protein [Anaerolineales bacterium]
MISEYIQINHWKAVSLLLAIFLLLPATSPVLTPAAPNEITGLEAGYTENFAPCESAEGIVLGREGGLLSLLGADGHSEPVAIIVKGESYSPQAIQSEQLATYVGYVRTDC